MNIKKFDEGNKFLTYKKFWFDYRQCSQDDAWESLEFSWVKTLNGSSHHNMEKQCTVKRLSCSHRPSILHILRIRHHSLRVRRILCKRMASIQRCMHRMGEPRLTSIHCRSGCCRLMDCKDLLHKDHQHRILSHHIRALSSKFHVSPSFSRPRQQRQLRRSWQRQTMQSKDNENF